MPFKTLSEVRQANRLLGNHWFDHQTMKFFKTRIETRLYIRTQCFVTSEDAWKFAGPAERMYCVRQARPDGSIHTLVSHLKDREHAMEIAKTGSF